MGTVNVLNQMAEYDFNAKIDIEMIFEDSDDDEPSFQNALSERENINDDNNDKQDNISSENQINDLGLNKSMLSLNKNKRILKKNTINEISDQNAEIRNDTNYVGHSHNYNEFNANKHAVVLIGDDTVVINDEDSLPSPCQRNDRHKQFTTFIENVLNKLSEHIVVIMQSFYHYSVKKTNGDTKSRERAFELIKSHFFELSYITVESIFLPLEQNESFINQFLDNIVILANSKSLQWKFHRYHVLPFFNELVSWTKQEKEHIKNNRIPCHPNENIMFKQQLIRPLLPCNFPQSEIVANSNIAIQTKNNICLFSSGTPGNEFSINIDADTLIEINERKLCNTAELTENHNNVPPSCETTRRKTPVKRPTENGQKGKRLKTIQKKNPQNCSPPPHNKCVCSKNLPYRSQQYNHTNVNTNQTYYNNMGHPYQNHQNIGQPIPSYPTQRHYIHTNETSPSYNNNVNYMLYENTNNNIPMHRTQTMENEATSSPIITNVFSLNQKTRVLNLRCWMCGKTSSKPATPYDPYNRRHIPFYCSYLCRDRYLQWQIKPAAGPGWQN